jgi:CHASE2 domain-containing sensor protein
VGRGSSAGSRKWKKRLAGYREELLKALILTAPLALVARVNETIGARLFAQPWQAVWFLIPIAMAAALLRHRALRRHALHPDRRMLGFLAAYVLLFTVASQSNVLDVSRELSAFGTTASRRSMTPVSWGDWRYRLVPRKPDQDAMIVVLLRPGGGRSLVDTRKEVVDLVALATAHQAAGVALDVYFTEPSPIDPLLCQVIDAAARSMPVVVGYGFAMQEGRVVEFGVPSTLQPCLPRERLAHLAGFLDFDLVSRLTPLFFRGDRTRPALGLAVATAVHRRSSDAGTRADDASLDLPDDGLLRFVAPSAGGPLVVRFEELQGRVRDPNLLRGRFVMAGEVEGDSFDTAFGRQPGIVIHSYVAHSLIEGHYIRRHSWWLGFAMTLMFCYAMAVWCGRGASVTGLVLLCAGATAAALAVAVVSIVVGPYWFDVVYPVAAVWVLLPLLLGARRAIEAVQLASSAQSRR